ncbi:hypothetical protein F4781DRAFT_434322 [Annulohypoxylon bovei var. microspora]|nr:hypothetical protein F4781DRAFT_434322 [Annulohypoxylon bovei var. microspora]
MPAAVLGVVATSLEGAYETLVPLFSKIIFSNPTQKRLAIISSSAFNGLAVEDEQAIVAIINAILVVPALFVGGWHLYGRS